MALGAKMLLTSDMRTMDSVRVNEWAKANGNRLGFPARDRSRERKARTNQPDAQRQRRKTGQRSRAADQRAARTPRPPRVGRTDTQTAAERDNRQRARPPCVPTAVTTSASSTVRLSAAEAAPGHPGRVRRNDGVDRLVRLERRRLQGRQRHERLGRQRRSGHNGAPAAEPALDVRGLVHELVVATAEAGETDQDGDLAYGRR